MQKRPTNRESNLKKKLKDKELKLNRLKLKELLLKKLELPLKNWRKKKLKRLESRRKN